MKYGARGQCEKASNSLMKCSQSAMNTWVTVIPIRNNIWHSENKEHMSYIEQETVEIFDELTINLWARLTCEQVHSFVFLINTATRNNYLTSFFRRKSIQFSFTLRVSYMKSSWLHNKKVYICVSVSVWERVRKMCGSPFQSFEIASLQK